MFQLKINQYNLNFSQTKVYKKIIVSTILYSLIVTCIAQIKHNNLTNALENNNLVLNPGFEKFQKEIPCNFYYHYSEFNEAILDWKTPNIEKPKVFNTQKCPPDFFYSAAYGQRGASLWHL